MKRITLVEKIPIEWPNYLPYDTSKDKDNFIKTIHLELDNAIESRNWDAILKSISILHNFIKLGYLLPLNDRVKIVKQYFFVFMGCEIPLYVREDSMNIFTILAGKKWIPVDQLELPWKALFDLFYELNFKNTHSDSDKKMASSLANVIQVSRRFFPASSIDEIFQTFLPNLHLYDERIFTKYIALICLFFPQTKLSQYLKHNAHVQENNANFNKIIGTMTILIHLWFLMNGNTGVDSAMMDLLLRVGKEDLNLLKEILNRNEQIIPHLFSICCYYLELPFSQPRAFDSSTKKYLKVLPFPDNFAKFAILLCSPAVEQIEKSGKTMPSSDRVFRELLGFINMHQFYFHPSNSGKWSSHLNIFLSKVSLAFMKMIKKRENHDVRDTENARMVQEFTKVVLPIFMQTMFGKASSDTWKNILKVLLVLSPKETTNSLFQVIYPSLESPLQNHRTMSSINALTIMVETMARCCEFPEGPVHLINFMYEVIFGVDINDPDKAIASIQFFDSVSRNTALQDFSSSIDTILSMESSIADQIQESYCATSRLEDLVLNFLDKLFLLVENLPQEHGKSKAGFPSKETSLIRITMMVWERFASQLSQSLHHVALQKISGWIQNQCFPNGIEAAGLICRGILGSYPEKTMSVILPICIRGIKYELECNIEQEYSATYTDSHPFGMQSLSHAKLHWYQHIIMSLFTQCGEVAILDNVTDIKSFTLYLLENSKSRRAYKWTAKFIRQTLKSLLDVYPIESKVYNPTQAPDIMSTWGKWMVPADVKPSFHSPSFSAKSFAMDLFCLVLKLSEEKLLHLLVNENCSSNPIQGQLSKWVTIIRNLAKALPCLFLVDFGFDLSSINTGTPWPILCEDKLLNNLQANFYQALRKLFELHEEKIHEQVYLDILKLSFTLLVGCQLERNKLVLRAFAFSFERTMFSKNFDKNCLPRALHIERIHILHKRRILIYNAFAKETELNRVVLDYLLKQCLSVYVGVRASAQEVLKYILKYHTWCIGIVQNTILIQAKLLIEKVQNKTATDAHFLGLMQTISQKGISEYWRCNCSEYLQTVQHLFSLGGQSDLRREVIAKHALEIMISVLRDVKPKKTTDFILFFDFLSKILSSPSDLPSYTIYALRCVRECVESSLCYFAPTLIKAVFECAISAVKQVRVEALSLIRLILRLIKSSLWKGFKTDLPNELWKQERAVLSTKFRNDRLKRGSFFEQSIVFGCYQVQETRDGKNLSALSNLTQPIEELVKDKEYWQLLMKFLSEEDVQRGHFKKEYYKIFKNLVQIFEWSLLSIFKTCIEELSINTQDSSAQKLASELTVGLIVGAKFWPKDQVASLFSWLMPLLKRTTDSATNEGFIYWAQGLKRLLGKLDPQFTNPIAQWIISEKLDSEATSFFSETKKLTLKTLLMESLSFHEYKTYDAIFKDTIEYFGQDYGQVRSKIAQIVQMYVNFHSSFNVRYSELGNDLKSGDELVLQMKNTFSLKSEIMTSYVMKNYGCLENNKEKRKYGKTIIALMRILMTRNSPGVKCFAFSKSFESFMEPILLLISEEDKEFGEDVDKMMDALKFVLLPPCIQERFLTNVSCLLQNQEISSLKKIKLLHVIQYVISQHAIGLDTKSDELFFSTLIPLLRQQSAISRESASAVSILARCYDHKRKRMINEFESLLEASPYIRKNTSVEAIWNRHGALLGLSALVNAYPFTIPTWMPRILMILAFSTNQPAPISNTLNEFFLNFKKTHQDMWHLAKEILTEEEYSVISELLVSPSHYI